jgi:hypothetical protein
MSDEPLFSTFERWPDGVFYAPIFLYWFWLAARYRSLTLPTVANLHPALTGFLGESKAEALDLLGAAGRARAAPWAVFDSAAEPAESLARARAAIAQAGLSYPLVIKPDVGQNGNGVKVLAEEEPLRRYLERFPARTRLIVQKYIEQEGEAGVFYVRRPGEERGRIASLTLKYFPRVVGDGARTLRELIEADPRARKIKRLYFKRHGARLAEVVPAGVSLRLLSVGNHCKGALFKDGAREITPAMEAAFDRIAREIPGFYFGRFDVRFGALADLKRGEDFSIIEVNGADAEMTHIWDARATLLGAWRDQFRQFRTAFEIGAANRARGHRPATPAEFIRAWRRNRRLFSSYPCEE